MFSQGSFKNATVPELVARIREEIGEYERGRSPEVLREIRACLEQARQTLFRAQAKAGPHDKKRLKEIEEKKKEIVALKEQVDKL